MEKTLDAMIQTARESAGVFGLIYIDLNEFKQVNDLHGHLVGDMYLQEVSQRMKRQLRPGDVLARLGGDEFSILLIGRHDGELVSTIRLSEMDTSCTDRRALALPSTPKTPTPPTVCCALPTPPCMW